MKKLVINILISMFLLVGIMSSVQAANYNQTAAHVIQSIIDDGLMYKRGDAKYYMSPLGWGILDYQAKKNLVIYASHHYVYKGGGALRAKVYNSQTGKLLGETCVFCSEGVKLY